MWSLFIFVILIFNVAMHPNNADPSIIFKIQSEQFNGLSILTCDHSRDKLEQNLNTYTVYEGENITIVTKYNKTINEILCHALIDENFDFTPINTNMKNVTTFTAEKRMGTLWKCKILAHLNNAVMKPVVQYKNHNYSAAYCYLRIDVRYKVAPQTILVNNVALPAVRINQSEKDIDFMAEYQYADGDLVNVVCTNFLNEAPLTMEYEMAGTMSDKLTMNDLSSSEAIGFVTKLYSGHNNSYMICTHTEAEDYTKVMVKFVRRSKFNNIVFLKINGIPIRPYLENPINNYYRVDYKYISNQTNIKITCEVERTDVMFLMKKNIRRREELTPNKKVKVMYLNPKNNKKFECATNYLNGTAAEIVVIHFTAGEFPIEELPMHMALPSNGIVMELYNDYKLNVIYYEFIDGETLDLTCGQLPFPVPAGPVLYLELDSEKCATNGCSVSKTLHVGHKDENTEIVCYLKEREPIPYVEPYTVHREIRVILRERLLNTTNTMTTTTTPSSALTTNYTASKAASSESSTYYRLVVAGLVVAIIILVAINMTIKKRCCVRSNAPIPAPRLDPATVFYENLLAVFRPVNEREAAAMELHYYEEIRTHKRLNIHQHNLKANH